MFYFCTYFDKNYLPLGLTLYRSLREHCPDFKLWVLCMDNLAYEMLKKLSLPGVHPISQDEFEQDDDQLKEAKQNRSRIEYYFTCSPSLPLYVLDNWPEVDLITYLDADLFFFSSPMPLFEELGDNSISIIGHRFPPSLKHLERFGIYNVGWLSFRRDDNGLACLNWWRERCIEWCYDREEDGRFADQKYLDDWPSRFQKVIVLQHKGANLAPWNLSNYHLQHEKDRIVVDNDQSLIFFHFHGLKKIKQWLYNPTWNLYCVTPSRTLRRKIYTPYIKAWIHVQGELLSLFGSHQMPNEIRKIQEIKITIKDIISGKYIFSINGFII